MKKRGIFGNRWLLPGLIAFFTLAHSAWACPLCDTETGRQVRAGIFGEDFGLNVWLTLAPFPVLLGVMALVCWAIPDSPKYKQKTGGENE